MYFVYVLISLKDRRLYVGYTENVQERFTRHESGHVPSTKNRRPLELIYYEAYSSSQEAKTREKYLKGGNGRAQLKIQIKDTLEKYNYKHL